MLGDNIIFYIILIRVGKGVPWPRNGCRWSPVRALPFSRMRLHAGGAPGGVTHCDPGYCSRTFVVNTLVIEAKANPHL